MQTTRGTTLSAAQSGSTEPAPARRSVLPLIGLIAIVGLALDQATKAWALAALGDGRTIRLVGSLLGFRLVANPGAAFSMGSGATWLFTVIGPIVMVAVVVAARRTTQRSLGVALGLLLAGALGNFVDRLVRPPGPGRGHVVDFIDYQIFVGNVADIFIVVAAGLLILYALIQRGRLSGVPDAAIDPDSDVDPDAADADVDPDADAAIVPAAAPPGVDPDADAASDPNPNPAPDKADLA